MQEQFELVSSLLSRSEIKKAEMIIARHLRSKISNADRSRWLIYRARARLAGGRPEEALDDLLTSKKLSHQSISDQPELIELMADCHLARFEMASVGFADRNDTKQAEMLYTSILDRFSDYSNVGWVYYQMGRIALTDNQNQRAELLFKQALFAPSTIRALTSFCYERLGFIAFYDRRDHKTALGLLNKAVDTYPLTEKRSWLVQTHILRSKVLRETRDYPQALSAAEMALSIAMSSTPEDRHSISESLLTSGELLAALEGREADVINYLNQFLQHSRKPLGIDVTWSRVYEMMGDAYTKLGQYENACQAFDSALTYNPYHPWLMSLQYRLARAYYLQGKYELAIATLRHLLDSAYAEDETVNDYRIFDILGNAQFATGKYPEAAESYRKALDIAPLDAENLNKIRTYYQFSLELS